MSEKTTLLFGIHMHQPIDNFQWVIEHAINVCYAPFFDVVSKYPTFKFSVHCSGWLMEQPMPLPACRAPCHPSQDEWEAG